MGSQPTAGTIRRTFAYGAAAAMTPYLLIKISWVAGALIGVLPIVAGRYGGRMSAVVSPTQRLLSSDAVATLVRQRLGTDIVHCGPISGGGFAAVWRATVPDGDQIVIKVGPPPEVPLLRYERGMIPAEARYFRQVRAGAPEVPVPDVLHADDEVIITTLLPGRTLADLHHDQRAPDGETTDDGPVREGLGRALAAVHRLGGDRFGYDGAGRAGAAGWRDAFTAIVTDVLADGDDWDVVLAVPPHVVLDTIARHGDALDEIRRPTLVHFDLWDGNVLCAPDPAGALRLTGLVDGERYLFGDPLFDFVSPVIGRRIEDEPSHPVLRGYYGSGGPHRFTDGELRRLALYRIQFLILLAVEMPSRGMTGDPARARRDWVDAQLVEQVRDLG